VEDDALDEVVVDPGDGPAENRVSTKRIRYGSIEIDFADADAAAQFLELMARLIRTHGRIRVVLE